MEPYDLKGRRALVTGSHRGLGVVLARGLAEAGATVVLNGRNTDRVQSAVDSLRKEGYDAAGYAFDVTDEEQVARAVRGIEQDLGPVDILVNNAGIQKRAPLEQFSLTDWQAIISTHLTGAFLVAKHVARSMIERGRGKIINVCSVAAEVGRQGIGPYTAAKGGLRLLTRAMCADWARYNIQINGIAPGYFVTDMTESLAANPGFSDWVIKRTPAGRWGNPQELVGVLLLLASDGSSFINGQVIAVDGGVLATM